MRLRRRPLAWTEGTGAEPFERHVSPPPRLTPAFVRAIFASFHGEPEGHARLLPRGDAVSPLARERYAQAPEHRDVLQIQHDGQISSVLRNRVKPRNEKYSALQKSQIRRITLAVPCPQEGRLRDRHGTWGAGCDGRRGVRRVLLAGRNVHGGRRSRVVLAPRPWRQAVW